jgi:hypothetical protein
MSYDNNLSGALFKNTKKEKDTDPLYKGSCEIEGRQFWISSWLNTSKDGEKYMALKFKPKESQPAPPAEQTSYSDSDIPF